jgi:hypothetical protein
MVDVMIDATFLQTRKHQTRSFASQHVKRVDKGDTHREADGWYLDSSSTIRWRLKGDDGMATTQRLSTEIVIRNLEKLSNRRRVV